MARSRLDGDIHEWARSVMSDVHKSGFPGINAVERILRDPGITSGLSRDKILYWPRNRRLAKINKAMHQVPSLWKICLIIDTGYVLKEDGQPFTKHDLARYSSMTVREFNDYRKKGKAKLSYLLGY